MIQEERVNDYAIAPFSTLSHLFAGRSYPKPHSDLNSPQCWKTPMPFPTENSQGERANGMTDHLIQNPIPFPDFYYWRFQRHYILFFCFVTV